MGQLQFTFDSYDDCKKFAIAFCNDMGINTNAATSRSSKASKKDDDEQSEKETKKESKKEDKKEEKTGPSYDQVRASMMKLVGTDEEDSIPIILKKLGVEKLSELKEDKFQDAIDKFEKVAKIASPVSA